MGSALTIIRKGETKAIELPVSNKHPMLIESLLGRYPSYFVYGPLVFSNATTEFDRFAAGSPRCSAGSAAPWLCAGATDRRSRANSSSWWRRRCSRTSS